MISCLYSCIWMLTALASLSAPTEPNVLNLQGSWNTETYYLKDGTQYDVKGLIFFLEGDWGVIFFVIGKNGQPSRGSAEGGTYRIDGNRLDLTHLYHLSAGEPSGSLAASPLRMELHEVSEAPQEPCTFGLEGTRLTIFFPSGNRMTFLRRPGGGEL